MKGLFVFLLTVIVVLLGCQSDNVGGGGREQAAEEKQRGGWRYYKGIGWYRVPWGTSPNILTNTPTQLLEYTRKAMKEERFGSAMFAAKYFIGKTPNANAVAEMRMVIGEVYERRGFHEDAFKEYQKLLDAHPDYENTDEVFARMYRIATLYLGGKSFRWKLPYQETVYIPTGSSMAETAKLYTQIVTNAPYGAYAAQSQFGIGQAHERALKGFWGFFADEAEYDNATRAYRLLLNRYSYRKGDKPKANQKEINEMVAQARFRSAEIFEKQANEGIYDQSMTDRAISAFNDFTRIYEQEDSEGVDGVENRSERVSEAKSRMNAMYLEKARGLKEIALFYEKNRKWVAADRYYGAIAAVLNKMQLVEFPEHKREAEAIGSFATKRRTDDLFRWRIIDALEHYSQAQNYERKNLLYSAQRFYQSVNLNMNMLPSHMQKAAAVERLDIDRLKQIKAAVKIDLERVQQLIDKREIEERSRN
tara:strand:+ start:649 stop:2079 length:1431 start_codon:yes stop_codon:yes gene_type:complete